MNESAIVPIRLSLRQLRLIRSHLADALDWDPEDASLLILYAQISEAIDFEGVLQGEGTQTVPTR